MIIPFFLEVELTSQVYQAIGRWPQISTKNIYSDPSHSKEKFLIKTKKCKNNLSCTKNSRNNLQGMYKKHSNHFKWGN